MNTVEGRKIVYQAIFINPEDIQKLIEMQGERLPKEVKNMHCTFKYQPSESEIKKFSELLGREIVLRVVGYCSDGKNSGFEIELSPEEEKAYTNAHSVDRGDGVPTVQRTTPHITVSMQEGAKAVDTGTLPFSREGFKPFDIHGKAGFFTFIMRGKDKISEVFYEPVLIESRNEERAKTKNMV